MAFQIHPLLFLPPCVLGRDALSPTSVRGALEGHLVVPAPAAAATLVSIPALSSFSPPTHECAGDGAAFADALLSVYAVVTGYGLPNFQGTRSPVPTNLNSQQWEQLCVTPEDHLSF